MFSTQPRCLYRANPLGEVICQLVFPEILTIGANPPADFQEAIRDQFPRYSTRQEALPPRLTGGPGNLQLQKQAPVTNYQFLSQDGVWRVNLTGSFISLACSRYTRWEDFAKMLDKPLAAFIRIYKPSYFQRVGLRYLNFFSRKALDLEGVPYRELFAPCWLGPLAEEEVSEATASRCTVDAEFALRGGCRAKIHAGPGNIKRNGQPDPEVKFIFDMDLYMPGDIPVKLSAGALQTLHSQAFPLFRGAMTDLLHRSLEPETL